MTNRRDRPNVNLRLLVQPCKLVVDDTRDFYARGTIHRMNLEDIHLAMVNRVAESLCTHLLIGSGLT